MRRSARRLVGAAVCAAFVALAAGCTSMLETTVMDVEAPTGCLNGAGAYFLPKKVLTVEVKGKNTNGGKLRGYGMDVTDDWLSVPDRHQSYCLDYLGSITSRDEVGIVRSPEGLLKRIYTRAEDRSVQIAKTLIDTAFLLGAAGGRQLIGDTAADTKTYAGPFAFDPFDPFEAAKINAALRPYGYCVFVEGFSFPSGVPPTSWCERPQVLTMYVYKAPLLADPLPPIEMSRRGVLYRPNITRTLTIMRKADPYGRDPWLLMMTKQVEVPNRAPVFAVEVSRSMFVDRVTDLEFDNGVLTNVSVKKPSEAAAFVEIPLAVVSAVVALPGTIVKLKINDANNTERLIRAQTELIAVRRQHLNAIEALTKKHGNDALAGLPISPSGLGPFDTFMRGCMSDNTPQDVCAQKWQDIQQ